SSTGRSHSRVVTRRGGYWLTRSASNRMRGCSNMCAQCCGGMVASCLTYAAEPENPIRDLARTCDRFVFFTSKGGVGKTSVACATAVRLADAGKTVLLISTDPASNLDEVLGVHLAGQPRPVPGVPRLFALNLDPTEE